MRLDELTKMIQEASEEENPEVRFVSPLGGGFIAFKKSENFEVHHRKEYYDENIMSGDDFEKGDFVVLDFAI